MWVKRRLRTEVFMVGVKNWETADLIILCLWDLEGVCSKRSWIRSRFSHIVALRKGCSLLMWISSSRLYSLV